MYLNKLKLMTIMSENHSGNYRQFAKELKVEVAHLHRILNTDAQAGTVFLGRLHKYCKENQMAFDDFIFFD